MEKGLLDSRVKSEKISNQENRNIVVQFVSVQSLERLSISVEVLQRSDGEQEAKLWGTESI